MRFLSGRFAVRELVDNVGQLRIDNRNVVNVQDLSELLAKLILRQSVPFFDVDLSVHSSNGNSSYILQVNSNLIFNRQYIPEMVF